MNITTANEKQEQNQVNHPFLVRFRYRYIIKPVPKLRCNVKQRIEANTYSYQGNLP
jgi:hypothetical protein